MRTAETQIRLGGCPGWSESSVGAQVIWLVLSWDGSNIPFVLQINDTWVSKSAESEREKTMLEQTLKQKLLEYKGLQDNFSKLKEEDRMKDIFLKERDNDRKEKTGTHEMGTDLLTTTYFYEKWDLF